MQRLLAQADQRADVMAACAAGSEGAAGAGEAGGHAGDAPAGSSQCPGHHGERGHAPAQGARASSNLAITFALTISQRLQLSWRPQFCKWITCLLSAGRSIWLHSLLPGAESVDRVGVQEEGGAPDEDARARDVMYERAERLAASLARMGDQLRTAIDNVNSASSASQVCTLHAAHALVCSVLLARLSHGEACACKCFRACLSQSSGAHAER